MVNIWTLRIKNPIIQASYRKYQREEVRDHSKMLIGVFLGCSIVSLAFYVYLKLRHPDFGGNQAKIQAREYLNQAVFQNLISIVGITGIITAGIFLSRRWLLITELIFPTMLIY